MIRSWRFALPAALLLWVGLSACATSTLTQSPHDRREVWGDVWARDMKALAEDVDMVLLMDRPSRLTSWHDR